MRERRGAIGRTLGAVADSLVAAARSRQVAADPRVVIYDTAGHPRRLRAGTADHDELLDAAERLIALVRETPEEGRGQTAESR